MLRGAAGLGLAAAVSGILLPACGSGDDDEDQTGGPDTDGPLETTSIRLHSFPNVSCIAAEYMAEPFLYEEGFTDVQYLSFPPAEVGEALINGDFDFGIGYAAHFTCDILKEIPYDIWREFDPVDSVRFYALQMKEAGLIDSTPGDVIKRSTDFRYLTELKRELKVAQPSPRAGGIGLVAPRASNVLH